MNATTVLWKQGLHFCAKLDTGDLHCDESATVGRPYPSSPELLMASLGSCVGSVLVLYAGHHGLNLEGLKIDLAWDMAEGPHRIGEITVSIHIPQPLSAAQRSLLERVAHTCLIHNTLSHPPKITLKLTVSRNSSPHFSPAADPLRGRPQA